MATPIAKTKEARQREIINELISAISNYEAQDSFINQSFLQRISKEADELKEANWAMHYELLAYIQMYKKNYLQADKYFLNAIRLQPLDTVRMLNHKWILMALGRFDEVEDWILKNYSYDSIDKYSIQSFYQISLANLEFSNLKKYIEQSYSRLSLEMDLDAPKANIIELEKLANDIEQIHIDKALFKKAMIFIYRFFRKHSHNAFRPFFKIDTSDMPTLIIELFMNVEVNKAVELTSDFEEAFVDFSIEQDDMELLRKFSVFIKPSSLLDLDKEYPVYTGINKDWVV